LDYLTDRRPDWLPRVVGEAIRDAAAIWLNEYREMILNHIKETA
jgi:hypothetical protein